MKPVLQYPGSKVRMSKTIIDLLGNDHGAYVEPYVGSAAVFLAKPRVPIETLGDANDRLVSFYRVMRDNPYRLATALLYTPYSRTEFELSRLDSPDLDDVERARRFMVRLNQAFVGSNGQGNWTATTRASSGHSNASKWFNYMQRMDEVAHRFRGVQIENVDALELIGRSVTAQDPRIAMYLDPPYVMETRNGVKYESDIPPEHHAAMLALAVQLPGPTVISGYDNHVYNDALEKEAGWTRLEYATASSSGPGKGSVAKRIEVLWASPACQVPETLAPADEEGVSRV